MGKIKEYFTKLSPLAYVYAIAIKKEGKYPFLLAASIVLHGLKPFINIVALKYIVNELMGSKSVETLLQFIIAAVSANLLADIIDKALKRQLDNCHKKFALMFDDLVSDRVMNMDFELIENAEFHNKAEAARSNISSNSGGLELISEFVSTIFSSLITVASSAYIIFGISPWLVVMMLIIVVANTYISFKSNTKDVEIRKQKIGFNRKYIYYFNLGQLPAYAKDIRLYDASDMIIKRTDEYREEYINMELQRKKYINLLNSLMTALSSVQMIVLYTVLGLSAIKGAIPLGDFLMLISSANIFSSCLSDVMLNLVRIRTSADLLETFKEFMEYKNTKAYGSLEAASASDYCIEFRNVSFRYPGNKEYTLKNINLAINSGEKLSIVGENGAGKTTLIKLLTRLYDPSEGEILINGENINRFTQDSLMSMFSVVFQDYKMLPLSIAETVTISDQPDETLLCSALDKSGFTPKLRELKNGTDTIIGKSLYDDGIELSGGQLQKLAIARALYKDAGIVILDEPTAALDPKSELEVYESFNEMIHGKTTLFVSHRLASCRFCDKIAVFMHGEIVEYGKHHELIELEGDYRKMWDVQSKYYL